MADMTAIERLDLLMIDGVMVEITSKDAEWNASIRPVGGGFPNIVCKSESLSEAIKGAVDGWEAR